MNLRQKIRTLSVIAVMAAAMGLIGFSHGALSGTDKQLAAKTAPADAGKEAGPQWTKRCDKAESGKKGTCEIFQRLVVKDTGQRVAEFAVGFPEKKDAARGVVVLPLGILLTDGAKMQIDKNEPFTFKPRFCAPEGCFAYVNLNKQILDIMKKGTEISITFQTVKGDNVTVKLSLDGFGKSLKEIG